MTSCEERRGQGKNNNKDGVLMTIKPGWEGGREGGRSFYDWSFAKCVILIVLGDKSSAGGVTLSHCLMEQLMYELLNKQHNTWGNGNGPRLIYLCNPDWTGWDQVKDLSQTVRLNYV